MGSTILHELPEQAEELGLDKWQREEAEMERKEKLWQEDLEEQMRLEAKLWKEKEVKEREATSQQQLKEHDL